MAWRVKDERQLPPTVEAALREQGELVDHELRREASPAAADPTPRRVSAFWFGFWGWGAIAVAALVVQAIAERF